jgi:RNA ligase (TIGR02306 family)
MLIRVLQGVLRRLGLQKKQERKLATIRKIAAIKQIENADLIEVAVIDGWEVVVKKHEFRVGELVVYFEIDSWVPNKIAPFLTKPGKEPSTFKGVRGERLRTVRLRGQISQGLVIGVRKLNLFFIKEADDVTAELKVIKWEKDLPKQLQGKFKGNFPTHLFPKTDEPRIQNIFNKIPDCKYEVTLKLDGSSCSIYKYNGKFGVCSRNYELDLEDTANKFVSTIVKYKDIIPDGLCFQGELMGPTIQNNREKLSEFKFFVYNIYDIQKKKYFTPKSRVELCALLKMDHVPIVEAEASKPSSVEQALKAVENIPSLNNKVCEGVVYKTSGFSFKVINNNFLLKEE